MAALIRTALSAAIPSPSRRRKAIAGIAGRARAEVRLLPKVADPAICGNLNGVRSMATSLAIRLDRGVD